MAQSQIANQKPTWGFSRSRVFEILEVGRPNDSTSRLVDHALVILIIVSVAAIVLESVDALATRYRAEFDWLQLISVFIFTGEYLLRVWSSPSSDEARFQKPVMGRFCYMLTPMALVDLLAILPFYLGMFFTLDLRFLRIVRLLRLLKLARYSPVISILISITKTETATIGTALIFLALVLVFASTGIYYFEHDAQPDAFANIPAAMWWAVATITTVGYGDITPITAAGKVFGAMISIAGVSMIAIPAGLMATRLTDELRQRRQDYHGRVEEAFEDGHISIEESRSMERLRESLGLSEKDASRIARHVLREQKSATNCPHCGASTEE